jgi:hypothetical protein
MLDIKIFLQFFRESSLLISVRNKYYFLLYIKKYSSFLFFLQQATHKIDNIYFPGIIPTRDLQT